MFGYFRNRRIKFNTMRQLCISYYQEILGVKLCYSRRDRLLKYYDKFTYKQMKKELKTLEHIQKIRKEE